MSGSGIHNLSFDPCPGDQEGVIQLSEHWSDVASELTEIALALDRTDAAQGNWKGEAAEAFRTELNARRLLIGKMRVRAQENADVLSAWARQLGAFQEQAHRLDWELHLDPSKKQDDEVKARQLQEVYDAAAQALAAKVSGLADLPAGDQGYYGEAVDVQALGREMADDIERLFGGQRPETPYEPQTDGPEELTGETPPDGTIYGPDGAFQPDDVPGGDFDTDKIAIRKALRDLVEHNLDLEDLIAFAEFGELTGDEVEGDIAKDAMALGGLPNAHMFFEHYLGLDGSPVGSDLNYDASAAYNDSDIFRGYVDGTVQAEINQATSQGATSFSSGYLYHSAPFGKPGLTPFSGNNDWANSVGGSYYQVQGTKEPDGHWVVTLRVTSYYQFRDGHDFGPISGKDMRDLERSGAAGNFRSIGTATLNY